MATKNFGAAITEEFYRELHLYATDHGLKTIEVVERAFEALKDMENWRASPRERDRSLRRQRAKRFTPTA